MIRLAYRPSLALEVHRDDMGRQCNLMYRKERGRHVVVYDRPGNPFPGKANFATVEEARELWRSKRREYGALGYHKVEV